MLSEKSKAAIDALSEQELRFEIARGPRSRYQKEKFAYLKVRLASIERIETANKESVVPPAVDELPAKPPEFLQYLKWLLVHGPKHWRLILVASGVLLAMWVVPQLVDRPEVPEGPGDSAQSATTVGAVGSLGKTAVASPNDTVAESSVAMGIKRDSIDASHAEVVAPQIDYSEVADEYAIRVAEVAYEYEARAIKKRLEETIKGTRNCVFDLDNLSILLSPTDKGRWLVLIDPSSRVGSSERAQRALTSYMSGECKDLLEDAEVIFVSSEEYHRTYGRLLRNRSSRKGE